MKHFDSKQLNHGEKVAAVGEIECDPGNEKVLHNGVSCEKVAEKWVASEKVQPQSYAGDLPFSIFERGGRPRFSNPGAVNFPDIAVGLRHGQTLTVG
jgi:hypothetical protein